ncbi:hypothetical protein IAQ61_000466 [Plenodomus lingam]|uniref:Avirulence protein AvrLm6 n=1 Tax=Leptosphaeria maculans TaxID=5022 RepID=A0A8K1BLD7_LEPMC|nr:hypothetical protein IAQ61_000466 [Plenodomus lingam]QYU71281.1 avirulence protein AvrLm6 [Plenodomus lingam]
MMIYLPLYLLVLGIATTTISQPHLLCACESGRRDGVDDTRTLKVVKGTGGRFVFSSRYWTKAEGAPHEGNYAHAINGTITKKGTNIQAHDDGLIGGEEMNSLCPEHSTCFSPNLKAKSTHSCGPDGEYGCVSAWLSVNWEGQIQ